MPSSLPESIYTLALHALRPGLPLLATGKGKLAHGIRGRRGVLQRMERWSTEVRDPDRPLLWFHAPSVGEGLQARAVIEAVRERRPEVQIVYTFFSPSAERFARSVPADFTDYLPFDLPGASARAIDLLRPRLIAFSKTDVWPNLTLAAERRRIPMVLLSATLPASSSRVGPMARLLLGPAYRRLARVAAISEADAARFEAFGIPEERRAVMGDARFDQVLARAVTARESGWPALLGSDEHLVLVAGSTWPPDEDVLLPALRDARAGAPPVRLILVPHEPTNQHLERSCTLLDRLGFRYQRLAEAERDGATSEVVLVDRVGVLGDLYAVADLAYVGGGWGTAGLHSVLEPAAFGVPVLFGPRHANAREAGELVQQGGAFSVQGASELRDRVASLLRDDGLRRGMGAAAGAYVEAGRGAAVRGAEYVIAEARL